MKREPVNTRWWAIGDDEPDTAGPDALDAWVRAVRSRSEGRLDALDFHCALYGSDPRSAYLRDLYSKRVNDQRLRFNLVQSVADTVQAQVCETRPKPALLTDKGSWSQQRRAVQVERVLEGDFSYSAFYSAVCPAVVLDACVGGTGVAVVRMDDDDRAVIERIDPADVLVDPAEARHGHVCTVGVVTKVQRSVARDLFPDAPDEAIDEADAVADDEFGSFKGDDDTIEIIEAWRCKVGDVDGLHVVAARGGGYLREPTPYTRRRLPVSFFHWRKRQTGFWSVGIAERLQGLQFELNMTLKKIQKAMELSTRRIAVMEGTKVNKTHITNDPQDVITYTGQPPIVIDGTLVPPELIAHRDRTIALAYEQEGVSQLSANSMKPAGLNSGEAQRVYLDNEAGRQLVPLRNFEAFVLDVADALIDLHDEMQDAGVEQKVVAADRKWTKPMDWDDVRMDREAYVLKIQAANALPRGSAGRQAAIDEWAQAGLLSREQWLYLREIPDTDAFLEMELAPTNVVLQAIERMAEEEEYRPPNPNQDLALTMKLTSLAICRFEVEGAPDEVLEALHTYFDDARALMESATQAQAATQAAAVPPDAAMQQQPPIAA